MSIEEKTSTLIGLKPSRKSSLVQLAVKGIKKSSLDYFIRVIKINPTILYRYLDVTKRSLDNYTPDQALRLYLSDRVISLAKFYAHGIEVFGSVDNLNYWLNTPSIDLNGQQPIDFILSAQGLQMVDNIIGRIEHGIPA